MGGMYRILGFCYVMLFCCFLFRLNLRFFVVFFTFFGSVCKRHLYTYTHKKKNLGPYSAQELPRLLEGVEYKKVTESSYKN